MNTNRFFILISVIEEYDSKSASFYVYTSENFWGTIKLTFDTPQLSFWSKTKKYMPENIYRRIKRLLE